MTGMRAPLSERILRNCVPEPNSGCWLWLGAYGRNGYGTMGDAAQRRPSGSCTYYAHRLAYQAFVGPIPPNRHVMHKCDNRACVNPDHLSIGTAGDNIRDCVAKGRHYEIKKTACPKGHPYTWEDKNGRRRCRICLTEQGRRWRAKRRASNV